MWQPMASGAMLKSVFLNMLLSVLKSNSTADAVFMVACLARISILILHGFAHSQDLKSQIN